MDGMMWWLEVEMWWGRRLYAFDKVGERRGREEALILCVRWRMRTKGTWRHRSNVEENNMTRVISNSRWMMHPVGGCWETTWALWYRKGNRAKDVGPLWELALTDRRIYEKFWFHSCARQNSQLRFTKLTSLEAYWFHSYTWPWQA